MPCSSQYAVNGSSLASMNGWRYRGQVVRFCLGDSLGPEEPIYIAMVSRCLIHAKEIAVRLVEGKSRPANCVLNQNLTNYPFCR